MPFRESTTDMLFLHPAYNRRCQTSRRLVSRPLPNNIPIYPNRPAPSCKTTSPSPIVPYRHQLILHRGRRAIAELQSPFTATHTKHYLCINDTRHTSSSDRILTYVCSNVMDLLVPALSSRHPPPSIYIQLIFLCLLGSLTFTFIYTLTTIFLALMFSFPACAFH